MSNAIYDQLQPGTLLGEKIITIFKYLFDIINKVQISKRLSQRFIVYSITNRCSLNSDYIDPFDNIDTICDDPLARDLLLLKPQP